MSKAVSVDLRTRVLAAVAERPTHREAAERFGVSAASVSRWRALQRERGDVLPGPLGGDRRSGRVEAAAGLILELLERIPPGRAACLECWIHARGRLFENGG